MVSSITILDWWVDSENTKQFTEGAQKKALSIAARLHTLILNEVQVIHTHFECTMPSHANLPNGYSSCWVPGDIMSNLYYDLDCHEPSNGELLSKILLYEFEHIIKPSGLFGTMMFFSQLECMGSTVQ
jgi:hypothetical protein